MTTNLKPVRAFKVFTRNSVGVLTSIGSGLLHLGLVKEYPEGKIVRCELGKMFVYKSMNDAIVFYDDRRVKIDTAEIWEVKTWNPKEIRSTPYVWLASYPPIWRPCEVLLNDVKEFWNAYENNEANLYDSHFNISELNACCVNALRLIKKVFPT